MPEESVWSGINVSNRQTYTVQAMRCNNCGYLEFYTANKIDLDSGFLGIFNS